MPSEFTQYQIAQDQIDRLTEAAQRVGMIEKSFAVMESKIERGIESLERKIDRLGERFDTQEKRIATLESDRRLYLAGVILALAFSVLAVVAVLWK